MESLNVSDHEPGFKILTRFIGYISNDYRTFLIVTSLISLLGPFYLIRKYSCYFFLSLFLYYTFGYYTATFNYLRQSIAVSVFCFAFPFLIGKKAKQYYFLSFVAISMHYSAILLLLLYPLVHKHITIKYVASFFMASLLVYAIAGSNLIRYIVTLLFTKYDPNYIFDNSGSGWNLFLLYLLVFVGLLLLWFKNQNKILPNIKLLLRPLILFQMIAVNLQLFATLYPSISRLDQFLFLPIIITIPIVYHIIKAPVYKCIFLSLLLLLCMIIFNKVFSMDVNGSNSQGVIPYVFLE